MGESKVKLETEEKAEPALPEPEQLPNQPIPQVVSIEDDARLYRGECVYCNERVLATHRRSKVKGGGYVHEWCKPLMGGAQIPTPIPTPPQHLKSNTKQLPLPTPPRHLLSNTKQASLPTPPQHLMSNSTRVSLPTPPQYLMSDAAQASSPRRPPPPPIELLPGMPSVPSHLAPSGRSSLSNRPTLPPHLESNSLPTLPTLVPKRRKDKKGLVAPAT